MSYWIKAVTENVLWLGASVVALIVLVALVVLERVDALAERARAARRGESRVQRGTARRYYIEDGRCRVPSRSGGG